MGQDFESIADVLPCRYRDVLDALDAVERSGARAQARRWRAEAILRYSRTWDAATLRWMDELLSRTAAFQAHHEAAERKARAA